MRKTLVEERTAWLERIQATLFDHGIGEVPEQLVRTNGRAFLARLELPEATAQRGEALALCVSATSISQPCSSSVSCTNQAPFIDSITARTRRPSKRSARPRKPSRVRPRRGLGGQPAVPVEQADARTGFVAAGLLPHARCVLAYDNAAAMLEVARSNLDQLGIDNVELAEAGVAALSLPDGAVDAAVANMVLHHATDPAAMIADMPGSRGLGAGSLSPTRSSTRTS